MRESKETTSPVTRARPGAFRRNYRRVAASFGTILDIGVAALDRYSALDATSSFKAAPTIGAEQALVAKHWWLRAGLDETTWTFGTSGAFWPFKLDIAVLRNLGVARTNDVFGKRNVGAFATMTFEYEPRQTTAGAT